MLMYSRFSSKYVVTQHVFVDDCLVSSLKLIKHLKLHLPTINLDHILWNQRQTFTVVPFNTETKYILCCSVNKRVSV